MTVYEYYHLVLTDLGWVQIHPDSITYCHDSNPYMLEIKGNNILDVLDNEFQNLGFIYGYDEKTLKKITNNEI